MKFDDVNEIDQICQTLRWSDYFRSQNRALISSLFDGNPPFSPDEVRENNIEVNINDLSATRSAHDGRSQLANIFLKTGNFFKCSTDYGAQHKRGEYSEIVTREINRRMKRNISYFETYRSKFALDILHGIGPAVWPNADRWNPRCVGIDDVFIPGGTELTMEDMPFFSIRQSWTVPQLIRMIRTPTRDPGWNVPLAEACISWADQQTAELMGTNYADLWSPEKVQERIKSDGACYAVDNVPTIDVFQFYFWHDDNEHAGIHRRIILDGWSSPMVTGGAVSAERRSDELFNGQWRNQFLYKSDGVYADDRSQILSFQFADMSAVAPFKYHSVRSLGMLLYSICHIQNRLRCKFTEAVFEALLMYFQVASQEDMQRALKVKMWNRGFIDETLKFVKAQDRYQVNEGLVKLGLQENSQLISDSTASYTANNNNYSRDKTEKTKFQVMAEVNAAQSLVSTGLMQAYAYQEFEDREIMRRFLRPQSTDPDVKSFRAACIKQGVPVKILIPEAWDCAHERVLGTGNKTQEMQIAEFLMSNREKFDPDSQRQILHDVTLAVSDNPSLANQLVPMRGLEVSDSAHDAQLAIGTLMQGFKVAYRKGTEPLAYLQEILSAMAVKVSEINQNQKGMATEDQVRGLMNAAQHVEQRIQILASDDKRKVEVKHFSDVLSQIMNQVRAFAQRIAEAKQKQNSNGQIDPEAQSKIAANIITAQSKAKLAQQSHAQRTAQRQVQFEQQMKQDAQRHQMDVASKDLEAAAEIQRNRLKSMTDPE
jgi:hypothetical protein